jgi:hypothetical protein
MFSRGCPRENILFPSYPSFPLLKKSGVSWDDSDRFMIANDEY